MNFRKLSVSKSRNTAVMSCLGLLAFAPGAPRLACEVPMLGVPHGLAFAVAPSLDDNVITTMLLSATTGARGKPALDATCPDSGQDLRFETVPFDGGPAIAGSRSGSVCFAVYFMPQTGAPRTGMVQIAH